MAEGRSKFIRGAGLLRKRARERFVGYVSAALALVAGLAWNDAIGALIKYLFPLEQNTILAKLIYAVVLTFFITLVLSSLERLLEDDEKE